MTTLLILLLLAALLMLGLIAQKSGMFIPSAQAACLDPWQKPVPADRTNSRKLRELWLRLAGMGRQILLDKQPAPAPDTPVSKWEELWALKGTRVIAYAILALLLAKGLELGTEVMLAGILGLRAPKDLISETGRSLTAGGEVVWEEVQISTLRRKGWMVPEKCREMEVDPLGSALMGATALTPALMASSGVKTGLRMATMLLPQGSLLVKPSKKGVDRVLLGWSAATSVVGVQINPTKAPPVKMVDAMLQHAFRHRQVVLAPKTKWRCTVEEVGGQEVGLWALEGDVHVLPVGVTRDQYLGLASYATASSRGTAAKSMKRLGALMATNEALGEVPADEVGILPDGADLVLLDGAAWIELSMARVVYLSAADRYLEMAEKLSKVPAWEKAAATLARKGEKLRRKASSLKPGMVAIARLVTADGFAKGGLQVVEDGALTSRDLRRITFAERVSQVEGTVLPQGRALVALSSTFKGVSTSVSTDVQMAYTIFGGPTEKLMAAVEASRKAAQTLVQKLNQPESMSDIEVALVAEQQGEDDPEALDASVAEMELQEVLGGPAALPHTLSGLVTGIAKQADESRLRGPMMDMHKGRVLPGALMCKFSPGLTILDHASGLGRDPIQNRSNGVILPALAGKFLKVGNQVVIARRPMTPTGGMLAKVLGFEGYTIQVCPQVKDGKVTDKGKTWFRDFLKAGDGLDFDDDGVVFLGQWRDAALSHMLSPQKQIAVTDGEISQAVGEMQAYSQDLKDRVLEDFAACEKLLRTPWSPTSFNSWYMGESHYALKSMVTGWTGQAANGQMLAAALIWGMGEIPSDLRLAAKVIANSVMLSDVIDAENQLASLPEALKALVYVRWFQNYLANFEQTLDRLPLHVGSRLAGEAKKLMEDKFQKASLIKVDEVIGDFTVKGWVATPEATDFQHGPLEACVLALKADLQESASKIAYEAQARRIFGAQNALSKIRKEARAWEASQKNPKRAKAALNEVSQWLADWASASGEVRQGILKLTVGWDAKERTRLNMQLSAALSEAWDKGVEPLQRWPEMLEIAARRRMALQLRASWLPGQVLFGWEGRNLSYLGGITEEGFQNATDKTAGNDWEAVLATIPAKDQPHLAGCRIKQLLVEMPKAGIKLAQQIAEGRGAGLLVQFSDNGALRPVTCTNDNNKLISGETLEFYSQLFEGQLTPLLNAQVTEGGSLKWLTMRELHRLMLGMGLLSGGLEMVAINRPQLHPKDNVSNSYVLYYGTVPVIPVLKEEEAKVQLKTSADGRVRLYDLGAFMGVTAKEVAGHVARLWPEKKVPTASSTLSVEEARVLWRDVNRPK